MTRLDKPTAPDVFTAADDSSCLTLHVVIKFVISAMTIC